MGTLFIISTPIGCLQDITFRAVNILKRIDVIACEDTRRTGKLLEYLRELDGHNGFVKKPRLISYFEHNEADRIPEVVSLLQSGIDVALVSDAGTPAISDPGFKLIRACIAEGIHVEAAPGVSSVLTGLVVSGLPTDKFLFLGYFPRKESHIKKLLESLTLLPKELKHTAIFFEAPHRIIKTLGIMKDVLGEEKEIVLARELTKVHEEVIRKKLDMVLEGFKKKEPRGEFVVMFQAGGTI